jgi:hypothetical protein
MQSPATKTTKDPSEEEDNSPFVKSYPTVTTPLQRAYPCDNGIQKEVLLLNPAERATAT